MDDRAAKTLHDDPRTQVTPWSLLLLLMAVPAAGATSPPLLVPAVPQMSRDLNADIASCA